MKSNLLGVETHYFLSFDEEYRERVQLNSIYGPSICLHRIHNKGGLCWSFKVVRCEGSKVELQMQPLVLRI